MAASNYRLCESSRASGSIKLTPDWGMVFMAVWCQICGLLWAPPVNVTHNDQIYMTGGSFSCFHCCCEFARFWAVTASGWAGCPADTGSYEYLNACHFVSYSSFYISCFHACFHGLKTISLPTSIYTLLLPYLPFYNAAFD